MASILTLNSEDSDSGDETNVKILAKDKFKPVPKARSKIFSNSKSKILEDFDNESPSTSNALFQTNFKFTNQLDEEDENSKIEAMYPNSPAQQPLSLISQKNKKKSETILILSSSSSDLDIDTGSPSNYNKFALKEVIVDTNEIVILNQDSDAKEVIENNFESSSTGLKKNEEYLSIAIDENEIANVESDGHEKLDIKRKSSIFKKWSKAAKKLVKTEEEKITIVSPLPSPSKKSASKVKSRKKDRKKVGKITKVEKKVPVENETKIEELKAESSSSDSRSRSISQTIQNTDTNINSTKLLSVKIHQSDPFELDPFISHPLVRFSIIDSKDGSYAKSFIPQMNGGQSSNISKKKRKDKTNKEEVKSSIILPVLTQPYLKNEKNVSTIEPKWEETLLVEEPFDKFLESDSFIFFFEIMDFLNVEHLEAQRSCHGNELGWHKVAWAFLRPLSFSGIKNVNQKLRLQLYKPGVSKKNSSTPEVFAWWLSKKCQKLKCTLHVTVKGILPPSIMKNSVSALLSMRKEELTEALIESQLSKKNKRSNEKSCTKSNEEDIEIENYPTWDRIEGQMCKVPNKLFMSLPSSSMDSINIKISGNVQALSFSPCGLLLAAGIDNQNLHLVLIFEFPSGKLKKSLRGHHGIIYSLDWKVECEDNILPMSYLLSSASGDATVIIWLIKKSKAKNGTITSTVVSRLQHPSFVYSAKFHPRISSQIATGCFDSFIRIWDISMKEDEEFTEQSSPIFTLSHHQSFINCIEFHPSGNFLFSGDGLGHVCKWNVTNLVKSSFQVEKEVNVNKQFRVSVNSISVHPSGNKILVHARDSFLKILDIETFLVLTTFNGFLNERLRIQSCFSPCGNLVLCGSEDSRFYIWDSDTAKLMGVLNLNNHFDACIPVIIYHPFDNYLAIGLSSAQTEPHPILIYSYEPPKLNISSVVTLKNKLKNFRSSSHSSETETHSSEKFKNILRKLDEVGLVKTRPKIKAISDELLKERTLIKNLEVEAHSKLVNERPSSSSPLKLVPKPRERRFSQDLIGANKLETPPVLEPRKLRKESENLEILKNEDLNSENFPKEISKREKRRLLK